MVYTEAKVYQKAYGLVLRIYGLTHNYPSVEQYGMTSQMRRAAVSIPLNIAEGFGKMGGKKETVRFLSMARGSCCEMDVLLNISRDLGYMSEDEHRQMSSEYAEVGKMLTGVMKSLNNF